MIYISFFYEWKLFFFFFCEKWIFSGFFWFKIDFFYFDAWKSIFFNFDEWKADFLHFYHWKIYFYNFHDSEIVFFAFLSWKNRRFFIWMIEKCFFFNFNDIKGDSLIFSEWKTFFFDWKVDFFHFFDDWKTFFFWFMIESEFTNFSMTEIWIFIFFTIKKWNFNYPDFSSAKNQVRNYHKFLKFELSHFPLKKKKQKNNDCVLTAEWWKC